MYPRRCWKRYALFLSDHHHWVQDVVNILMWSTTYMCLFPHAPFTHTYPPHPQFLVDMSAKYHPEAYSLLNNNCNSFSNDLSQLLTGNTIPEHITNLPDVVRASPLGPMLVGFLDSMEQRMKAFAQQGHTFRPDVQHVEQYPTPNSYAGVLENKQENGGGGAGGEGSNGAQQEATNGAAHANGADTSNLAADKTGSAVQENATKKAFEQQLRAEFDRLMAGGGLTPNEAAAQALRNLRDKN